MAGIKKTPFILETTYDDGEVYIEFFEDFNSLCVAVCKIEAFSDCEASIITNYSASANGRTLYYVGWQPDMRMELAWCDTDEEAFVGYFPQWEH